MSTRTLCLQTGHGAADRPLPTQRTLERHPAGPSAARTCCPICSHTTTTPCPKASLTTVGTVSSAILLRSSTSLDRSPASKSGKCAAAWDCPLATTQWKTTAICSPARSWSACWPARSPMEATCSSTSAQWRTEPSRPRRPTNTTRTRRMAALWQAICSTPFAVAGCLETTGSGVDTLYRRKRCVICAARSSSRGRHHGYAARPARRPRRTRPGNAVCLHRQRGRTDCHCFGTRPRSLHRRIPARLITRRFFL